MAKDGMIREPVVDWLTVIAIAAISISLTVAFHEGIHALTCVVVGGDLLEYSALYESCDSHTVTQAKLVAGSAPTLNLLAGIGLWIMIRKIKFQSSESWFFVWLLMMMNFCYGSGYFIFSGISNIGDWAVVLEGWNPGWLWRGLMVLVGVAAYMIIIRLGLIELGKMIGGEKEEQVQRANKLCSISYITSFLVILFAGVFCPYGPLSLPVTAGVFASLGALSPLIFMTRWFRTEHFDKVIKEPLEIHRKWGGIMAGIVVVFLYAFILGRTIYF